MNTFKTLKKHTLISLLVILAGCAGRDVYAPKSANTLYFCDHTEQIIISLADQGERAALSFRGNHMTLERIDNKHFSNSIYDLFINDDVAVLEREGAPFLTGCKPAP